MEDQVHIIESTKELVETVLSWNVTTIRYIVADSAWIILAGQDSAYAREHVCQQARSYLEANGITITGSGV